MASRQTGDRTEDIQLEQQSQKSDVSLNLTPNACLAYGYILSASTALAWFIRRTPKCWINECVSKLIQRAKTSLSKHFREELVVSRQFSDRVDWE